MTILIAPDKFKGSLTADEACRAIREGLSLIDLPMHVMAIPLADGGEGTSEVLTSICGGSRIQVKVMDPLFREIESEYGITQDRKTAFIEMAKASGLQLLKKEERNPLHTSTFGTGQLILDAIGRGANHIILGIGGSATNDAGIGMATALGFAFRDKNDAELSPVGENLSRLQHILDKSVHPAVGSTRFTVLCDVDNPLTGDNGSAFMFGGQKGASRLDMQTLDEGLRHFQEVAETRFSVNLNFPGAGAAGGLGAGAKVFLHAGMEKGFDFISRFTQLESTIRDSDLVITGEGKIDLQTLSGKVVKGVAALAAKYQKPCIAFTGECGLSPPQLAALHVSEVISLTDFITPPREAMVHAYSFLRAAVTRHVSRRFPKP